MTTPTLTQTQALTQVPALMTPTTRTHLARGNQASCLLARTPTAAPGSGQGTPGGTTLLLVAAVLTMMVMMMTVTVSVMVAVALPKPHPHQQKQKQRHRHRYRYCQHNPF